MHKRRGQKRGKRDARDTKVLVKAEEAGKRSQGIYRVFIQVYRRVRCEVCGGAVAGDCEKKAKQNIPQPVTLFLSINF